MRITSLTLETLTESGTGTVEFDFTPARPVAFRAGQAGLFYLRGGRVRPITFSSDDRCGRISIATTLLSGSRFKRALAALRPGDHAFTAGPIGSLPAIDAAVSQVLVAQGIGITPFLSMARSNASLNATLLQVGAPHFFDEVATAVTSAGHYQHRADLHDAIGQAIADRPTAQWTLSGRSDFVTAVSQHLIGAGVPARRIHKDAFWTMRSAPGPTKRRDALVTT